MNVEMNKFVKYFFVLLLGFLIGVSATLLAGRTFFARMLHNRPEGQNAFIKKLASELELDDSQQTKFAEIMRGSFTNMMNLRKRHLAEFEKEMERTRNELKTVLSSNQMEILQKKMERMKRRHKMPPTPPTPPPSP